MVVDGQRAFVGGINYSADHLADFGPQSKQDYAIEVEGPIVAQVYAFVRRALIAGQRNAKATFISRLRKRFFDRARALTHLGRPFLDPPIDETSGGTAAIFVARDNCKHTNDIERHYRIAIRASLQRIVIANAYFPPATTGSKRCERQHVVVSMYGAFFRVSQTCQS